MRTNGEQIGLKAMYSCEDLETGITELDEEKRWDYCRFRVRWTHHEKSADA